jgi:hypothetical protein
MASTNIPNVIKSDSTILTGILISFVVSIPIAGVAMYLVNWIPWNPLVDAVGCFVSMTVTGIIFKMGLVNDPILIGFVGIGERWDDPTGKLYGPGKPWLIPIIERIGPRVEVKDATIDPAPVKEIAKNTIPILIDDFFVMSIVDPLKTLNVADVKDSLSKQFVGATTTFIREWNIADDLRGQGALVCRFLGLPPQDGSQESKDTHTAFRAELNAMRIDADDQHEVLSVASIDRIRTAAGGFKQQARDWGVVIKKVDVRSVDLPPEILAAAIKRAQQKDEMGGFEVRNASRLKMAQEIVAADTTGNVSIRDAYNLVDRMMDYGVKTTINEWDIRDLSKVVDKVGKPLADAAKKAFNAVTKDTPEDA